MDSLPLPVYDDYFERLEHNPLAEESSRMWLPYESARGCWWAIKHVCTFCAANAQYLSFRSKQPDRVRADVVELSRRYGSRRVWFVDNIMEERYLRELFPRMQETPVPMFVETRAHVSRDQLEAMRDAGVMMVQLGIESFSTPILRLMEKGTTAIQNIRVVKWCAELGIRAFYNLIYGFPGESPAEYASMADAILSLTHLEAPNPPVRLRLDRFSPYHRDPERFGVEVLGPYASRRFVYDLPERELAQMEYFFDFEYKDRRDPNAYAETFVEACRQWRELWQRDFRSLHYHETSSGLRICDSRSIGNAGVFELGHAEARVYLGCDAGTTLRGAWESLSEEDQRRVGVQDVARFLQELVEQRLVFAEGEYYLSLAVQANEARDRHASGENVRVLRLGTPTELPFAHTVRVSPQS
jgi:ribosomal peptide maturation radical SAM protein 1